MYHDDGREGLSSTKRSNDAPGAEQKQTVSAFLPLLHSVYHISQKIQ